MLLDRHRAKIVTADQLVRLIGPRPRSHKVVMCNGVFDVVHPGHIRHLLYAKSKADRLVCGITSDRHISKGPYRPHVPQDLRAQNLAVLDFVDHIVISDDPKPNELIRLVQPDYYAKGFEYSATTRPDRTIEETAVVESYGGEMLFTPGDIVYSSSRLIERYAPDLRWEKLAVLMQREGIRLTCIELRDTISAMHGCNVHVVGDVIVDRITNGELLGWSGKTPTPSIRKERSEDFVGGAGIVAQHALEAGARTRLTTLLGDDKMGVEVIDRLSILGIDVCPVVDQTRPTTIKEVLMAGDYRMVKLDTVDNRSINDDMLNRFSREIVDTPAGSVIFADFRHGIFNARTIPTLSSNIPDGCLRVADSQVASRWGNITEFRCFDLITPNEREARFALGDQDSGIRPLASRLYDVSFCKWLLLKLGPHGILGSKGPMHDNVDQNFVLDSFADTVVDPVGAGDAFLAYSTLALMVQPSLPIAAILGSLAAGLECGFEGNVPVSSDMMLARVDDVEKELAAV